MASRLSWWLGGTALSCALIAAAGLPPRGLGVVEKMLGGGTFWRERPESPAVTRRNELAVEYQRLNGELQALKLREQAEPLLRAARGAGRPSKVLLIAPDTAAQTKLELLQPALDSAWHQLGLGETKISVVLAVPSTTRNGDRPSTFWWWRSYLLPDSTDRTTCTVLYPVGDFGDENLRANVRTIFRRMALRVRNGLGPCAFYARFGAPSPRVRRWLDANSYDVAENSDWSGIPLQSDPENDFEMSSIQRFGAFHYYSFIYSMQFRSIACAAGREAACVEALSRGDRNGLAPYRRVVTPARTWKTGEARLVDQTNLLAEIVKKVDDDAFQKFWTTSLPVDSALTVALEQPVGKWIASRKGSTDLKLRLGPMPPLLGVIEALLIAAAFLGVGMVLVQRRQVR